MLALCTTQIIIVRQYPSILSLSPLFFLPLRLRANMTWGGWLASLLPTNLSRPHQSSRNIGESGEKGEGETSAIDLIARCKELTRIFQSPSPTASSSFLTPVRSGAAMPATSPAPSPSLAPYRRGPALESEPAFPPARRPPSTRWSNACKRSASRARGRGGPFWRCMCMRAQSRHGVS